MEILVEFLAKGFMVMLSISMPCVLVAAMVGLVVGILQAVTSVQEQTIAAAPKICLVFLAIVVLGGHFLKILTNYFYEGVHIAFQIVPKNDSYVLPKNYYKYTHPFAGEMNDKINNNSNFAKGVANKSAMPWDKKTTKHQIYVPATNTDAAGPNFLEKMKLQQTGK